MEVCVDSVQSAINAEKGGAKRLELCCNLLQGGTTPTTGLLKEVRGNISIPVFVMIRPRGGDFLYSTGEFEVMKEDVKELIKNGADGIVFGVLLRNGEVDAFRCQKLLDLAKPKAATFHRAFDMVCDQKSALETIVKLGFSRVLTSGGKTNVSEGLSSLKDLVDQAKYRIIVVPGSGISEHNLEEILRVTGAKEFHGSAKVFIGSNMEYRNSSVCMGEAGTEYGQWMADIERVQCFVSIARQFGYYFRVLLSSLSMHFPGAGQDYLHKLPFSFPTIPIISVLILCCNLKQI